MEGIWKKVLIFLGILLSLQVVMCNVSDARKYKRLYLDSQDTITKTRNKYGQELSAKNAIILSNKEDFLKLQTKDSSIRVLQKMVKDFEGKLSTAISIVNSSSSSGKTITKVIYIDTVSKGDNSFIYPIYTSSWNDEWDQGQIIAERDSIFRYIQIKNKYELTIGKSKHWFKPNETKVRLLNLNPNTVTQEVNAVQIQSQQKKLGFSLQLGYGFSNSILPSPYLGIGLGYQLISIR